MACNWDQVRIGRSEVLSSAIGLGSSFGIGSPEMERAFERGINYFYWGSIRRPGFGSAVKNLARKHRENMVVVVQSYTRVASLMRVSLEVGLRRLGLDYADFLLLGWWNQQPPERIMDSALALQQAGRVRKLMISCHHRPSFESYARNTNLDAIMVRYNAAHSGAEEDVFPLLGERPPGVVAYTATRWGDLLTESMIPEGEPTPRASDCYRFVLSNPNVQVSLAGPKNAEELDEAMTALDRGPMDEEELAWMRRVGGAVRQRARANSLAVQIADRLGRAHTP